MWSWLGGLGGGGGGGGRVGGKRKTIFSGLKVISAMRALCGGLKCVKIDAIMLCSLTRSYLQK